MYQLEISWYLRLVPVWHWITKTGKGDGEKRGKGEIKDRRGLQMCGGKMTVLVITTHTIVFFFILFTNFFFH